MRCSGLWLRCSAWFLPKTSLQHLVSAQNPSALQLLVLQRLNLRCNAWFLSGTSLQHLVTGLHLQNAPEISLQRTQLPLQRLAAVLTLYNTLFSMISPTIYYTKTPLTNLNIIVETSTVRQVQELWFWEMPKSLLLWTTLPPSWPIRHSTINYSKNLLPQMWRCLLPSIQVSRQYPSHFLSPGVLFLYSSLPACILFLMVLFVISKD